MDYRIRIRHSLASLLFLLPAVMSCSEDAARPAGSIPASFESTVAAGTHDRVVYTPAGNMLSIEVISIEDSRCPTGVFCFWAGVAKVEFSIAGVEQNIILY